MEAAAREYFGVHASELTLAQAALLAGLPKAPSRYSPLKNPERAVSRQHYVLSRLLDLGWITEEEYEQARAEELVYESMADPSWTIGAYALEEVRRRLVQEYGEDQIYKGGLKVRTSVDLVHQQAAEKALRHGLEASTKRRGWRGPVRELAPEQVESFLAEQEIDVTSLEPGTRLQAVVTDVFAKTAKVAFADSTGTVSVKTMGWARALNPAKAPEEVRKISDATRIIKKGDVILVSVVEAPEKDGGQWTLALEQEPVVQGGWSPLTPRPERSWPWWADTIFSVASSTGQPRWNVSPARPSSPLCTPWLWTTGLPPLLWSWMRPLSMTTRLPIPPGNRRILKAFFTDQLCCARPW